MALKRIRFLPIYLLFSLKCFALPTRKTYGSNKYDPPQTPEAKLSLVNYLDRVEQRRGNKTLFQLLQNTNMKVKNGGELEVKGGAQNTLYAMVLHATE